LPKPDDPIIPSFPAAAQATFVAPQRLVPDVPPQPPVPTPTHTVHHDYYDPADFHGRARRALPFTRPSAAGLQGYHLLRASIDSLALADLTRRASGAGLLDNNPVVVEAGVPRADLKVWITQLSEWLSILNARLAAQRAPGPFTPLTAATVLTDPDGRRGLVEHFYYGLLDDELRALADVAAPTLSNLAAFGRVNVSPLPASSDPLFDTVDGNGDGRFLYKLQASNQAGTVSGVTQAAGPYYTRVIQPPHPPVLSRTQPIAAGVVVAWALDPGPDAAGYLVYRSRGLIFDLRYFGRPGPNGVTDPSAPAKLVYQPGSWPPLAFAGTDIDPRLVALVPEPRLFARDSEGSDMAEVTLPMGLVPSAVNGVYRASEFDASGDPLKQPRAFNYWRPPPTGISQLAASKPARLIGLRVGLGRGVPVVVVVTVGGDTRTLGALAARRAAFLDSGTPGHPADASALPGWTPPPPEVPAYYAVVAVDRFCNRSARSDFGSARPPKTT
jgi:hypothetical protein